MDSRILLDTLKLAHQYLGKAVADNLMTNCARPVESAFRQVGEVITELEAEQHSSELAKPLKTGAQLIAIERERQMSEEGWDAEHDDQHTLGELARVGELYALPEVSQTSANLYPSTWSARWWRTTPQNRVRELVKAGALIAAEIDRLQKG